MNQSSAEVLETLLRRNGLGWMIDMYAPKDRAIPAFGDLLDRVTNEYRGAAACRYRLRLRLFKLRRK